MLECNLHPLSTTPPQMIPQLPRDIDINCLHFKAKLFFPKRLIPSQFSQDMEETIFFSINSTALNISELIISSLKTNYHNQNKTVPYLKKFRDLNIPQIVNIDINSNNAR